jgi:NAD-dependent dihydropyrimidine dehydrogenase PreA subunit
MAYVVCQPCIGTKDRSCVEVCPVDCFYDIRKREINQQFGAEAKPLPAGVVFEGSDGSHTEERNDVGMLMIHADECINCGACESECPVQAIYEDSGVPEQWASFVKLNAETTLSLNDEELDKARCTSKLA